MANRMKMDPVQRKEIILEGALTLARSRGLAAMNYRDVADQCEIHTSPATVRRYVRRIPDLQRAIVDRALRLGVPEAGQIAMDARMLKIIA